MIIGSLISVATASVPMFLGSHFYIKLKQNVTFPLLGHVHVTTVTLFELGILLTVVGVIVTVMLSISGVDHEFNITPCDRIFSVYWNLYDFIY